MKFSSNFVKCSICLEEKPLTWEHIIPESIGGTLESDIQCVDCNSNLGSRLVSEVKKLYPVRLAIQNLQKDLPELYKKIEEGQEYTGIDEDKKAIKMVRKKGKIRTLSAKLPDESIIVEGKDTEKHLKMIMTKDGIEESHINNALDRFKGAPSARRVKLTDKVHAIKWNYKKIYQTLGKIEIDERTAVLIAYNYLAIVYGEQILSEKCHFIRQFILGEKDIDRIEINQYPYTDDYKTYHRIFHISQEDSVKVRIILFDSIVIDIIFHGTQSESEKNWIIVEDLKRRRLLIADTIQMANNREYYTNK